MLKIAICDDEHKFAEVMDEAITHQAILASKGIALPKGTGFNVTV